WLTKYMVSLRGVTLQYAGNTLSVYWLGLAGGRLGFSLLLHPRRGQRVLIGVGGGFGGGLGGGGGGRGGPGAGLQVWGGGRWRSPASVFPASSRWWWRSVGALIRTMSPA